MVRMDNDVATVLLRLQRKEFKILECFYILNHFLKILVGECFSGPAVFLSGGESVYYLSCLRSCANISSLTSLVMLVK